MYFLKEASYFLYYFTCRYICDSHKSLLKIILELNLFWYMFVMILILSSSYLVLKNSEMLLNWLKTYVETVEKISDRLFSQGLCVLNEIN